MDFAMSIQAQPKKLKRALMRSSKGATSAHTHNNKTLLDSLSQSDFDTINNLAKAQAAHPLHGVINGMSIAKNSNPRYFNISSGVYYINGIRKEFGGSIIDTVSIPGGNFATASINSSGSVSLHNNSFLTPNDLTNELELTAFSKLNSNTIDKIGESFFDGLNFIRKIHLRHKLFSGTLFDTNAGAIDATGLNINITGGYINTPNSDTKTIDTETTLVGQEIYRVGGVYDIMPESTIVLRNSHYDNGNLTTLSNNKYVTHTIARSTRTEGIYVIIGDAEYTKLDDAIHAEINLGIFANTLGSEIEPLANVIIKQGETEVTSIIDTRGGTKVVTTALASSFDSRLTDLENRIAALEGA